MQINRLFAATNLSAVLVAAAALPILLSAGCGENSSGARHHAAVTQAIEGSGSGIDPESLAGVFALKVTLPVQWQAGLRVAAGSGSLVQFARVERSAQRDGDTTYFQDTIGVCGVEVPEQSIEGKIARLRFKESEFGERGAGEITIRSSLEEHDGQTKLVSDWATFLLGADIPDAEHAAWPAYDGLLNMKAPGMAAAFDFDPTHNVCGPYGALISKPEAPVLTNVWVATRNIEKVSSNVFPGQNDRIEGTVEVKKLDGNKWALQSTMLRADLNNGKKLDTLMVRMAEKMTPDFSPAQDDEATAVLVRIDRDTSCAQIRALDYN